MIGKVLAAALAASLIAGAALADPIDDLLAGKTDPLTYDFGQLRDQPDADAWLKAAEGRVQRDLLRRRGIADDVAWKDARPTGCWTEAEQALLRGVASARKVKTAADWSRANAEAQGLEAKRQSVQRILFSGEASPYEQLNGVARRLKMAREAKDPILAELFRRNAEDNFARMSIGFSARHFLAPQASDAALDLYDAKADREICLIDEANLVWLKKTIAERGWFRISRDGQQADDAARNLVQHADDDPAFQQRMLAVLEAELAAKETTASGYAYLYDRVAVNTGKPQRYATQGRCAGPGDWRADTLEDPDAVEARRLAVGIDWPMKDYVARMNSFCR
ncbi:DUF6624 domain-containing protein [Caulobacter mirabilis]|uniref:Uncharacterized protein n=1 Tax=Caulobacter mirabilis TaxID=69666 RepID=A0A2D2ATG3_9CAUL|nr:DUF6624 domain-containing protein [Caulobacter mirabilis]ATQ41257.1 hypothetical protein CSW64_01950 [Caulobacter mirabilis]